MFIIFRLRNRLFVDFNVRINVVAQVISKIEGFFIFIFNLTSGYPKMYERLCYVSIMTQILFLIDCLYQIKFFPLKRLNTTFLGSCEYLVLNFHVYYSACKLTFFLIFFSV